MWATHRRSRRPKPRRCSRAKVSRSAAARQRSNRSEPRGRAERIPPALGPGLPRTPGRITVQVAPQRDGDRSLQDRQLVEDLISQSPPAGRPGTPQVVSGQVDHARSAWRCRRAPAARSRRRRASSSRNGGRGRPRPRRPGRDRGSVGRGHSPFPGPTTWREGTGLTPKTATPGGVTIGEKTCAGGRMLPLRNSSLPTPKNRSPASPMADSRPGR